METEFLARVKEAHIAKDGGVVPPAANVGFAKAVEAAINAAKTTPGCKQPSGGR
jgi:hypothetical protein